MDPRQFAEKKLSRAQTRLAGADPEARRAELEKITEEFPLACEFWLQWVEAAAERTQAWDRALAACPDVQELWTAFLQSHEGATVAAAERAKDCVGRYFLSGSVWRTLLDRIETQLDGDERAATKTRVLKEAIRVHLYDYAEFYQLANDSQDEEHDLLFSMAETVGEVTTKRWEFESELRTSGFQTGALDEDELTVWDKYLDYSESLISTLKGSEFDPLADCVHLYRKCLVVTALYPRFWRRFYHFLRGTGDADLVKLADRVLEQALHYHPKNRSLRLLYAQNLETTGNLEAARRQFAFDADELVAFDLRHHISAGSEDLAYQIAYNRATGRPMTTEMIAQAPELFNTVANPLDLMDAWEQGLCPDVEAYAERLREAGHLEAFFKVDSTLS